MSLDKILSMMDYEGNICSYLHREISGNEFSKIFADYTFVKLTSNDEEKAYATQEQYGKYCSLDETYCNVIDEPKGIYFTNVKNTWTQISSVVRVSDTTTIEYMRKVLIPNDAKVYIESNKFRTNKLILYPKKKINNKIYMKAIEQNILDIRYVPMEIVDKNIYEEITKSHKYIFKDISTNIKNICIEVIKSYGYVIGYCPLNVSDRDICLMSVKKNGYVLEAISLKLIDKNVCLIGIKQYNDGAIVCSSNEFMDIEICKEAVKRNVANIIHVPQNIREKYF